MGVEMPETTSSPVPPRVPPNSPVTPRPVNRNASVSAATNLYQDRYVKIVNTVSGYGLLAGSHGLNAGDRNVWQYPLSEVGPNAHGFEWILFPTLDGSYLIVNRVSGMCLLAGSYGAGNDRHVWQYPVKELGTNNPDGFKWGIEPEGNAFRIVNRVSGFALLPGSYGAGDDRLMWQYPISEGGPNPNAFLWTLIPTDPLTVPALRPGEDEGVRGPDIPRLTSMKDTPPTKSASWVVAEVRIPFMYVNDGAVSFQLQSSPYYILSREQYWLRTGLIEYDGAGGQTEKQTIETGITETSSRSIENELKITIAADSSFSYGAASVALKTEIQNTLKVSESTSHSQTHRETKEITITVPTFRCRVVTWQLAESFTLWRSDRRSTVGQPSETILDRNVISDIWTERGAEPLQRSQPARLGPAAV
jgi:insecticidal crystal toxin P42 protein/ricin-type beta-trefoil lectin protein